MKQPLNLFSCGLLVLTFACGTSGSKESSNTLVEDQKNEIRLKQYKVKGSEIYAVICANCHQKDGSGLQSLFPPLAGSDYLMSDLKRAACLIKNGQKGEIVVNGTTYNQAMPSNEQLTPLEVAEVLTYITNTWGNDAGLSNVKDVEKWLTECH